MADIEEYRQQALNNLSKPKEEEPKEEPKKEPQKPASKVEEYRQQALNHFSKPKEISEDTIKNAAKPEPKKTKEVVKKEMPTISEEVKSEEVTQDDTKNKSKSAPNNTGITSDGSMNRGYAGFASEEEAKKALQDAGVDPNKVDSKEGAEEETSKIVDKLLGTGLFEKDKDGKLTYIGINIEPDAKRKAASVLGKIGTAASIIGALVTGGAIPPMNLNNFFLNEDDTKAYEEKLKQMTDTVNKIIDKTVTKDTIKAQTEAQKELKTLDQEFEMLKLDKIQKDVLKRDTEQFKKDIAKMKINFSNQEHMAELLYDHQVELPGKVRESNILTMKKLKDALGEKEYEAALKTIAGAIASEQGTTPAQLKIKTAEQIVNTVTKPIADILGAVTGGE